MNNKKKFSVFDYTITICRKHRYLVVGSPEFGYQVASGCLELGKASPEAIGNAVLDVLSSINRKLYELDHSGIPHPEPRRRAITLARSAVSAREAARILGVTRPTLRRLVQAGVLRAQCTPGGHLRFSLDGLSDYLFQSPAESHSA